MSDTIESGGSVDAALGGFREMLAADGFAVSWAESAADKVVITIEATPDACADCLVPEKVMTGILSNALKPTPYELDHVVMPHDH